MIPAIGEAREFGARASRESKQVHIASCDRQLSIDVTLASDVAPLHFSPRFQALVK